MSVSNESFALFSTREFSDLALDLLDRCYKEDNLLTMQQLTVQLDNWSKHTCLSLAAMAQHQKFMGHACCQVLLNDLWHGGLQAQKYISIKVREYFFMRHPTFEINISHQSSS